MKSKSKRPRPHRSPAATSRKAAKHAPAPAAPARVPYTARRLMRSIFAKNDPVDVATRLLNGKADSTVGRTYGMCLEYLYGKPVQPAEPRGREDEEEQIEYQFVSNIPRPHYPPPHRAPGSLDESASAAEHKDDNDSTLPAVAGSKGR